ncbi:ADP-ribosylation factor-like protein 2-binding protein [Anabarilius grahami]|uniref:ADP-ribosylation factor-like protein 2-binding protein n=1 Tax=Anabarilius grahami TaxID=495550 RepID=A0A3N0YAQ1_ANAGA|nr:ADP-ribosylation factor-like protein 2-binding protein [Anabarilius grahami]
MKGNLFLPDTFRTSTRSPVAVAAATSGRTFVFFMMDRQETDLLGGNENIVEMQNLEEEDFAVSKQHKDEVSGDILDMLLTFTDFMAFKEMFIDYRAEKEGRGLDLSTGLVVKSLNSASASPLTSSMASQSS